MTQLEKYKSEMVRAMNWLAERENTLFLGQAVRYAGTGMYDSLTEVPDHKKLEFPVAENFQLGYSTGLALNGIVPVSIFPRWNFLLCGMDQLVNHLDKLYNMSAGKSQPKVIIRVAVGTEIPVDPQDQHRGDFSEACRKMLRSVDVVQLKQPADIVPAYQHAYRGAGSTILVEYPDYGK